MVRISIFLMYLVGILWIIFGSLAVFVPDVLRKKVFPKIKEAPLKKLSIIPLVIGILLLLAASSNTYSLVVVLIGLAATLKGLFGILATEKMAKIHDRWIHSKNIVYRTWGIIVIIIGSIVLIGI